MFRIPRAPGRQFEGTSGTSRGRGESIGIPPRPVNVGDVPERGAGSAVPAGFAQALHVMFVIGRVAEGDALPGPFVAVVRHETQELVERPPRFVQPAELAEARGLAPPRIDDPTTQAG